MSTLPVPPPIIIENPSGSTATIDAGPSPATATSEATDLPTSTSALCPSDPPIGFTDYLIAQTPELSRYFVKPHVKPDPSSPLQIHRVHSSGNHYRRLPEKLRFREMMKCAHQYYDERKDQPLWSIRMVKLFTGLLVPLAACWWALLWFGSLFRASTTARDSRSPVEIARAWALCLVFVLWTNWKCFGSIPGLFLPSKSPKWINEKAEMQEKGHDILAKVTKDLEALKQIYKITLAQRRASLASIQERLLADPTFSGTTDYVTMLEAYEKQHRSIDLIKNAIEAGDRDYQRVQEMTISELNAKVNHHKSIATWASEAYGSYSHLVNVLSGVCLVGAGLTYTAIFSAVRGNVGLMCYSFSLFIVALCIFITIQSMLVWCSHLTAAPIWDPNFWELVLIFFSCLGCLAVLGAIVLLIVTVYILKFNVTPGTEYNNPNAANWDARLEFDVAPKQGAILALSFMVAGVVAFVIIGALFVAAFGIRRVVWRRSDRLSAQLKLDDMA